MKFNIQLKEALSEYEKIVARERSATTGELRNEDAQPSPLRICQRPSEKVAGGDIRWKPIDRVAAKMLWKSPWWAKPPQVSTPKLEAKQTQPRKERAMSQSPKNMNGPLHPGQQGGDIVTEVKSRDVLNHELAGDFVKRTTKTMDESAELLAKALDARAAMDVMCEGWNSSWLDFQDKSSSRLNELRMTRIAMDSETRQLMAGLREIRNFFLDKDHSAEVARLKEFVEICERLQKLKESGFLDTVADTMLRLSERPGM